MGTYLNPGATALRQGRNSRIYVDKSGLISYLNKVVNTEQRFVCVSRPRRFGKSMAANMVCAYYDRTVDGTAEFSGLAIARDESFDRVRNRYDVLRIDVQVFLSKTHDVALLIEKLTAYVLHDLRRAYPDVDLMDAGDLVQSMADVYAQTGSQFVLVIDEWDCVMREMRDRHDEQGRYLDFLRVLLKGQDHIALCYMTGILPIKKYGTHSALNMFTEFGMTAAYEMAPYMGFTDAEVRSLCDAWGRSFDDCAAWYDGYRLAKVGGGVVEAYSPRSVVRAMETGCFDGYWNQTETYEALRRYIDLDMDGLHGKVVELLAGAHVSVNINTYGNDMASFASADDVLTLLVHLGYLAYDSAAEDVFVPNREVMGEFADSVDGRSDWGEVARSIAFSEESQNGIPA